MFLAQCIQTDCGCNNTIVIRNQTDNANAVASAPIVIGQKGRYFNALIAIKKLGMQDQVTLGKYEWVE